jgi:hypothetical protein
MFVTTLLSCRWLERIAVAKLQAIAGFVSGARGMIVSIHRSTFTDRLDVLCNFRVVVTL